jgi:hypothetical protein
MSEFETATNPVAGEENPAPEQEVEQEGQEQVTEGEGEESEQQTTQADDHDEIEHEGQKYRIPKAVKPLVMMQQDYTRKTQELAEQKRTWEQERTQRDEAAKADAKDYARLVAMDDQLEQWNKVNWAQWNQQDPVQCQDAWIRFNQLKDARAKTAGELGQKYQQRLSEAQQAAAKRVEEARQVIAREIPGWNDELAGKLTQFATSKGMASEKLTQIATQFPEAVKFLHAAYVGEQLIAKQKAATSRPAPKPEPVPNVSTSRAPAAKDPDRMSTKDWMEWRNKQVASRA